MTKITITLHQIAARALRNKRKHLQAAGLKQIAETQVLVCQPDHSNEAGGHHFTPQ